MDRRNTIKILLVGTLRSAAAVGVGGCKMEVNDSSVESVISTEGLYGRTQRCLNLLNSL